jgi:hypothetical protein
VSVEYLDLADYIGIASEVTGLDEAVIAKVVNFGLADSALHAPSAEFVARPSTPTSSTKPRW